MAVGSSCPTPIPTESPLARPCHRCIKRDLTNTCTDVAHKKSKPDEIFVPDDTQAIGTNVLTQLLALDDLGFGAESTGLEYGILSNMLQEEPPAKMTTMDTTRSVTSSIDLPFNDLSLLSFLSPTSLDQHQPIPASAENLSQLSHSNKVHASPPVLKRDTQPPASTDQKQPHKTNGKKTPETIYNNVKAPFNYAEGFHDLIRYVKERMGRDELMRISQALALFRPSFLALIMNLTEDDLIFMEKGIQRTLLEYEKLISFSGTPTVVWRRTGELCLVGKEFSLLTQWPKDMLLKKKKYIYELMDNRSAVEYWEKFSTHAFDNAEKACTYSCILKTPQQKLLPCTFCFTIKRDIFDLPSVIIGNFLPILS
ncbi:Transcriptional regulator of nonfermentable carbon utilization [Apophysomyces sp. BC1015]|nr:Transcriptional regulator of nonfermentable carbon utilization [Apophysomyces sp. BC1015]KAG0179090.1 Transcriptional regulator of nonfermentable carbon utilization [Apophysomyces sp. BC1021]